MIAGLQLLGGQWAILQTAAWVGMVVDYSKSEGVEAGITKAFDGKHPCQLCLSIAKNKAKEGKKNGNVSPAKLYLVYQARQWALTPPAVSEEPELSLYLLNGITLKPPVPPPRQCLG